MLADVQKNEELQQYLAEKSYDTASLGETSADELTVRSAYEISDSEIDIYKSDEISANYQKAQKLANTVKDYEMQIVQEHLNLDIYRAKGKSRSKISFNHLTL